MKYADLHVHTFFSDSTFSPDEVITWANKKGLSAIAITDHDSIDGIAPCRDLGLREGIEVIPAIEMTAEKADAEAHLLGYFINWELGWLQEKLKEIRLLRIERVHKMVEKLKAEHIEVDASEIFRLAGRGSVGRLHVAQAILNTGKVKSFREIFDKYIGFSKPCYVPYTKFSPEGAINFILKAGGVPVLAHPYSVGNDDYITEFIKYGLRGIEVYHTDHDRAMSSHYEEIAKRHALIATGGSDCHGMGKKRVLMGQVRVPYEVVEKLRSESEKIKVNVKIQNPNDK